MSEKYYGGTSGTYPMPVYEEGRSHRAFGDSFDETTGPHGQVRPTQVTRDAIATISGFANRQMADQAADLLYAIDHAVRALEAAGGDVSSLKPVRLTLPDDGSIAIEWRTPDFRIAFNIEVDIRESGWYAVFSRRLGNVGVHGELSSVRPGALASLAVGLMRTNS
jgi:hypothetical protein